MLRLPHYPHVVVVEPWVEDFALLLSEELEIVAVSSPEARYFRAAIEHPGTVEPWPEWWAANADWAWQAFDHADCIRRKFLRLTVARAILEPFCRPVAEPPANRWLHRMYCQLGYVQVTRKFVCPAGPRQVEPAAADDERRARGGRVL